MDTRHLTTADGRLLTADVIMPEHRVRAAVVVCHPHPLYGGNRFNPVVEAVFTRLPGAGCVALRFDFRREHDGGDAEVLDLEAAIDEIAGAAPGVPVGVVGYSFGAAVALRTVDPRIAAVVAIAPPLAMMPVPEPNRPVLVLAPEHDQFTDVGTARSIVSTWRNGSVEPIASADHFLAGHTGDVADRSIGWLVGQLTAEHIRDDTRPG